MRKVLELEYTRRTVPKDRLRVLDNVSVDSLGLRTYVKTFPTIRNLIYRSEISLSVVAEIVSDLSVNSQYQVYAFFFRFLDQIKSKIQLIVLADRLTDLTALRFRESISHTTRDDQVVYLVQQVLDDLDLGGNLRTTHDSGERTLDVVHNLIDSLHFFLHQITEHLVVRIEVVSDQSRRSVSTVSGTERVVYIAVSVRGQSLRELFLAFFNGFLGSLLLLVGSVFSQTSWFAFFLSVETKVLKQQSFARLQSGSLSAGFFANTVVCKLNIYA